MPFRNAKVGLALAIGSCTGAFRLIDAILLRPLPVTEPDRLHYLTYSFVDQAGAHQESDSFSYPLFSRMRESVKDAADLFAIGYASRIGVSYGDYNETETVPRQYLSGDTFAIFGLRPAAGRLLSPADVDKPGAHPVVVLSYDYWNSRFGRDPKIVGRTFLSGTQHYQIVGVAPEGFTGTEPGSLTGIFVPMTMNAEAVPRDDWSWFRIWMRPHRGATVEQVRQRLQAVFAGWKRERLKLWSSSTPRDLIDQYLKTELVVHSARSGASHVRNDLARALVVLAALVGLILLIACANVANLMMAQAASRAREMALRVSIGAGRLRLFQLVLVESAILAVLATLGGGLFAWWAAPWVVAHSTTAEAPLQLILPADWRVLGFAAALTATLLFGITPALRASAVKPMQVLRGGEDPHSKGRLIHTLVAAQVAFCFLVHFVAGLFVVTFDRLSHQPLGFVPHQVVLLETRVDGDKKQPAEYWGQIASSIRSMRGVDSVATCGWALMSGNIWGGGVRIPGQAPLSKETYFLAVSPGFLNTMRIQLLAGRDFTAQESAASDLNPAIVSEAFARRYFNGANPVGGYFERETERNRVVRHQIVGYIKDLRYHEMREPVQPVVFLPQRDAESWSTFAVCTSASDPLSLIPLFRQEVGRFGHGFRVTNAFTQRELVDAWTVRERLLASLATFFAVLALLLAGIGLYGVLNYSVLRRRKEIGIRMALGARAWNIAATVGFQVTVMLAAGSAVGLAVGLFSQTFLESLLYSVKATDSPILATPVTILACTALLAAIPPVIVAVRTDPAKALRTE